MALYCFYKVTNELQVRVLEAGEAIKFEVKAQLLDAPALGFMNDRCLSVYEVTRSIDEFSSLLQELGLDLVANRIYAIDSALALLDREPFYTPTALFFQNHPAMANPHLNHLQDDAPSWTNKLIRRFSVRSQAKQPSPEAPVLSRSRTEGLLRRMTWNRGRVAQKPSEPETLAEKPSLMKRIGSFRHAPSEPRPQLVRSATTKAPAASDAVEVDVALENDVTFRLTVGKDITYDRLLRGIRNKAVLTGSPLPPAECLFLQYRNGGRELPLKPRNVRNFLALDLPHRVLVRVNEKATPDARFSWLDLDVPARPTSRRLSRNCEGLDFACPKPVTTFQQYQQLESVEDYLRTPCQTEVQNIMCSRMWDTTPELQLSVCSSSSASPAQLSPLLPSEDFSLIVSQAMVPKPKPKLSRQRTVSAPRPLLQRSVTEAAQPKRVASLAQPPLVRQNSAPNRLDVASLAKGRSNRIKLTVAINKEFIIKLDLPDYHQATFTSLRNRIATKFSNAGYPLRSLAKMTLTYCQFRNACDHTVPITDTKSLLQILHKATDSPSKAIYLLLVPENLLATAEPALNRGGFRWDHPPNLTHVV